MQYRSMTRLAQVPPLSWLSDLAKSWLALKHYVEAYSYRMQAAAGHERMMANRV
jgi:hypothetical protein